MTIANVGRLPDDSKPKVSVVSLAYNRRENVRELLTMLRRQTYPSFEIILIDNASPDGTAEMVKREFPEVRLIETGGNLGMVAYNLGFEAARGEYILVMDDDGLPGSDDWIEQVVARFEANPRLGAVSCTIRMRDTGKIAYDSPQFVPEGNPVTGYPGVAFNGTGAGLRAEALRRVGGYPWHFGIVFLELYLCSKLIDAGWEVRHFPELEVWHSRASGSNRRHADYFGLRNYFWYVWEMYPRGPMLRETAHEFGRIGKVVWEKQATLGGAVRSIVHAFRGIRQPFRQRAPLKLATVNYLQWVRRHGNWHGIAPEVRPFEGTS
ncbi:MAG TPA: glycosyltransferase family 2 protein [Anaerolineae bacterium]|nr:glycosyltransferase family 2 protein [Anaerolineae bacterium]HQK13160.1 glycosyltransferase family 2 protein [Anaerolineae bacterium]